ncbi:DUF2489 domain-containing protein [Gilvimarinus sp. DA14]|uniref:DUF2489 domain-containing protein n=1 Tax=Gilvimarinus sp. DA14 TaxID=2956798 RepID=UPI0020B76B35|nr:DUF2489 domain-containing protein [Gilvimarinus sp. DA14]UTF60723.1 DUF2489 domain-containing protein [Gilvimarinus sp. DA14]
MSNLMLVISLVALAIVLILSVVALYYLLKLRELRRRQQSQLEQLEEQGRAQRERVNNSIQVIAAAVVTDEISLTEASIRVSVLLDSLGVEDSVREEFSAFYQLRDATAHIPILDAWKKLPTKQKLALDKEREQHEGKYSEFVLDAAQRIKGRRF